MPFGFLLLISVLVFPCIGGGQSEIGNRFTVRHYPNTLRWRQALPPLFVISLAGLALLSFFFPLAKFLLLGEILLYLFICLLAGIQARLRMKKNFLSVGLPLAIPIMHIAWGSGLLWSMLASGFRKNG